MSARLARKLLELAEDGSWLKIHRKPGRRWHVRLFQVRDGRTALLREGYGEKLRDAMLRALEGRG